MQQVNEIIQEAEISAVVIRSDGTVEDLGVIDSYSKDDDILVTCDHCGAEMWRHELQEHKRLCATISLAEAVNQITDRRDATDGDSNH